MCIAWLISIGAFFLQHTSTLSFDPALSSGDRPSHEFACLVVRAQSQDNAFFIPTVHGVRLLYHHSPSQPYTELLVIPPGGGLR